MAPVQDEDIMDMMTSSGFDLKIKPSQNMFLLVPNAKVFYEHIGQMGSFCKFLRHSFIDVSALGATLYHRAQPVIASTTGAYM